MIKKIKAYFRNWIKKQEEKSKRETVGYLGRDMAKK